jgi:hypothetical protein
MRIERTPSSADDSASSSGEATTVDVMARVLVTVGKTTLHELRRRGYLTVNTDYDGWELPDRTWDERRMDRLLARYPDVIVSGTVEIQGRFYDRFEHVVLLSAPLDVILERVSRRSNNPYGKTPEQRTEVAGLRADRRTAASAGCDPPAGRAASRMRTGRCHRAAGDRNNLICRGAVAQIWRVDAHGAVRMLLK